MREIRVEDIKIKRDHKLRNNLGNAMGAIGNGKGKRHSAGLYNL